MNWFKKRGTEASTWGGLGMITLGVGNIFGIEEAPAIAAATEQVGQAVMGGMPLWQAILVTLLGALMTFKSDGDRGF